MFHFRFLFLRQTPNALGDSALVSLRRCIFALSLSIVLCASTSRLKAGTCSGLVTIMLVSSVLVDASVYGQFGLVYD